MTQGESARAPRSRRPRRRSAPSLRCAAAMAMAAASVACVLGGDRRCSRAARPCSLDEAGVVAARRRTRGARSSFSWNARFVRMPVTTYSASARRMRATARSRGRAPTRRASRQRVVVARDVAARVGAAVVAHARARRRDERARSSRGTAGSRAPDLRRRRGTRSPRRGATTIVLREAELLAVRDADHLARRGRCPVTSSVTGCSTWRRVFISRK